MPIEEDTDRWHAAIAKQLDADAWRAAEAEARKRVGVAVCEGDLVKAREWQSRAKQYAKNSYLADFRGPA